MRAGRTLALGFGVALALTAPISAVARPDAESVSDGFTPCSAVITAPRLPSSYYAIDMVPTKRVVGTGRAIGSGKVAFARSPFGVAVSPEGRYVYDLSLSIDRIKAPRRGVYTAWAASENLDEVTRLGVLGDDLTVSGRVDWNKFLVIVSLEASDEPADVWQGPIVMRGMSRSGMMHTLAGHGPYENEPCLKYGFK